ncbi:SOS response-associated peptidase [Rhodanobacter denitrificans]|uniref:Abasic site processing protein n=1 Tax=Rhodanobacter denitrificans TaxID=666685 RepID=M4NE52_9GAMM|nr:SOS response-associated peptidase [Rhodanobacter denitrificans]AGG88999.1 hypothetical protein R2APBS1_1875 [Rhodanobacter denitrificans]UJJ53023.1 SOS response-associated peptidase [Rhodanobacter denitrificans]
MCGRFVQLPLRFPGDLPAPTLADELANLTPRYNLAPTQRAAVVLDADDQLAVRRLRWGLLPFWVKDLKQSYSTFNARIETVATKPAFRAAFKARRCVIPMAGYYEWRLEGKVKQPYYLTRADGHDLFAAGLWEPRHPLQDEDEAGSCTIIVTASDGAAATIHDRMPVCIPAELVEEYLRATPDDAMALMLAVPVPDLVVRPVSRRVNASRDDDPQLLDPFTPPE